MSRQGIARAAGPIVLALALLAAPPRPAAAAPGSNEDCMACHADPSIGMERRERSVSLHVDAGAFRNSVHAGQRCTDCHVGFRADAMPHAARIRRVDCLACHVKAKDAHRFHAAMGRVTGREEEPGVSCKGCHGTHDVASPKATGSPWEPARQAQSCGRCHADVARAFAGSAHGQASAAGVAGAPACAACHRQPISEIRAGGRNAGQKIAQERLCLSCHLNDPDVRARTAPTAGFIAAYEKSVHGRALLAGNGGAANCVDCHGAHEMKRGFDPTARVNKAHIPETCGTCHAEEARVYRESAHGDALARGNMDAPVCTNCHGEHDILDPKDPRSPVAPANVSAQVCSPCHSSIRLSEKYGIRADRFKTFSDSYHGLAIRGGDLAVANCASCHGAHDVRRSDDPQSRIHKANLAATCGQCHPGSDARFAAGTVHVAMTAEEEPLLYWIAVVYIAVIVAVVGGMLAHNALDFLRKARHTIRVRRGLEAEPPAGHALFLRMSLNERLQHATLLVSFAVLVVTGFMLRYPDAAWVTWLGKLSVDLFEYRSLLHRIAGVVMIAASLYHVGYLALTRRGRRLLRDFLPRLADATGAFAAIAYNLGLRGERPRFGRFGYVEKAEYWALVWGTAVMAATGIVLWFEEVFIGWITKLGWDAARLIHFYEAWLATLAILVWHIYYVVFNPDVYPMNMAWITGRLTEEEMAAEHPLELEAIRRQGADGPAGTASGGEGDVGRRA